MVLFALITVVYIRIPRIYLSLTVYQQWALTIADTFAFFEATRYLSIDEITSDSPTIYDGPHGKAKIALYIAQTIVGDGFFVRYVIPSFQKLMPTVSLCAKPDLGRHIVCIWYGEDAGES